jgi:hypothetical protein
MNLPFNRIVEKLSSWRWLFITVLTCCWAILLTVGIVFQAAQHRSLWFLKNPPTRMGVPPGLNEKELNREWKDLRPDYRGVWIWYRTPATLYAWTVLAVLGVASCVAKLREGHYHGWFIALGLATVLVAGFHCWAASQTVEIRYPFFWTLYLFPSSILLPIWCVQLVADWIWSSSQRQTVPIQQTEAIG